MYGSTMVANGVVRAVARHARRARAVVTRVDAHMTVRCMSSGKRDSFVPSGIDTSNPFEMKFHVDDSGKDHVPMDDTIESAESTFFDEEINRFHSEMIGVFGSEPEEHSGDAGQTPQSTSTPSNSESGRTYEQPPHHVAWESPVIESRSPLHSSPNTVAYSPPVRKPATRSSPDASVVMIQGPCTYVHGGWVGSQDSWTPQEVESMVDRLADGHGLRIAQHHSNHEGDILDWLLSTSPGDKIILNWNGRLADSPTIFRALSSIRAFVIVLTPLDVELGPLPPSVKGVITGFGTRSLELAIQACQ